MKYITNFCRIIVGIIFIISGLVKTIDPIGFSYKLEEYFGSGVFDIPFLQKLALPLSIFFVIFEVMLGIFILLGIWKKLTVYMLLLLMVFFSFLTFYSAYFNKVTDCGCFGDALKLEPWTSFWKDIILLILILILLLGIKYIKPLFSIKINLFMVGFSLICCCWITYMGTAHLPLIDFRPYAVGKDIKKGMNDGVPGKDVITYTLKNLKNGGEKKMTSDEYINHPTIWKDTLDWEITHTDVQTIKEATPASIHDFSIDCNGEDTTERILDMDKIIIVTIPFPKHLTLIDKAGLRKITSELANKKIKFVILTSDPGYLSPLKSCMMDPTTLKTINRSNPGFIILKKGVIVAKYHVNDTPSVKEIVKL